MAKIIETNLKNVEVKLGESLNMTCRSTGKPDPNTLWYKVDIQMAILTKHFHSLEYAHVIGWHYAVTSTVHVFQVT
jgi:hypothetical protein